MRIDFTDYEMNVEFIDPIPTSLDDPCCELIVYQGGQEISRRPLSAMDANDLGISVLAFNRKLVEAVRRVDHPSIDILNETFTEPAELSLETWKPVGERS